MSLGAVLFAEGDGPTGLLRLAQSVLGFLGAILARCEGAAAL